MDAVLYVDRRGERPIEEYLDGLERAGELSVLATFWRRLALLVEHGPALGMPYSRMIDRGLRLYELRFGEHRAAYAEHEGALVMLHCWRKRSRKRDGREAERARLRLDEWRMREWRY